MFLLELPRLRVYRFLVYLAVSVLVAGTASISLGTRLSTVAVYLCLGLLGIVLHNLPIRHPDGWQRLWKLSLAFDIFAHVFVVQRMGGVSSSFLLLLAIPILVWGTLKGFRGGVLAAIGTILLDVVTIAPWRSIANGSADFTPGDPRWQVLGFHAVAFLLLGGFAALLGRRIEQEENAFKQTRDELEQTQLDAESIVLCLSTGLLCIDAEGRIRRMNRRARELLGDLESIRVGAHLEDLEHAPPLAELARHLQESLARGVGASAELTVELPGGPLPLEIGTTPILGHVGVVRGLVVVLSDLTERREREATRKQEERLALIGQLSAGLAHEIRNSLKPITGSVELLRGELPAGEGGGRDLMEIILREAENLESFLSEFLSFARDKTLQVEPLPLERVLEEELESLRALSDCPIRLCRPDGYGLDSRVMADRAALGQVLRNLGLNALQADEEKEGLELGWRCDKHEAILFIRDHGPGVPPEIRDRVFDPFFTTKVGGTGLGLAIARDLVNRQVGRLTLSPAKGGGTIATVRLPLAGSEVSMPTAPSADEERIRVA